MSAFADGEPFFQVGSDGEKDSDWLICKHFKNTNDVIQYYMNLHSLVIISGVILCEECYHKLLSGKAEGVINSCLGLTADGWKEIFGLAIYKANTKLLKSF